MKRLTRRRVIKLGMAGTISGLLVINKSWSQVVSLPTPVEVEGPFYPVVDQQDKDADLTRIAGREGMAKGQHIIISGTVTDIAGRPINNATLDVWQANAAGRYNHPRDPNPVPHDPFFQGWAIIRSDENGRYRFKTVKPGAYPASKTWTRPPHIHFKITRRGFPQLITQMYFPDEPLNANDLLFNHKSEQEQKVMIAREDEDQGNLKVYTYDIVLNE